MNERQREIRHINLVRPGPEAPGRRSFLRNAGSLAAAGIFSRFIPAAKAAAPHLVFHGSKVLNCWFDSDPSVLRNLVPKPLETSDRALLFAAIHNIVGPDNARGQINEVGLWIPTTLRAAPYGYDKGRYVVKMYLGGSPDNEYARLVHRLGFPSVHADVAITWPENPGKSGASFQATVDLDGKRIVDLKLSTNGNKGKLQRHIAEMKPLYVIRDNGEVVGIKRTNFGELSKHMAPPLPENVTVKFGGELSHIPVEDFSSVLAKTTQQEFPTSDGLVIAKAPAH